MRRVRRDRRPSRVRQREPLSLAVWCDDAGGARACVFVAPGGYVSWHVARPGGPVAAELVAELAAIDEFVAWVRASVPGAPVPAGWAIAPVSWEQAGALMCANAAPSLEALH